MVLFYYDRKGNDMKNIHNYIAIIMIFIVLVFSITITHLYIKYSETGTITTVKKYYDIMFSNTTIDYESELSVKANSENDSLHIEIPNLKERKEFIFSVDVTNIGNVDCIVDNYSIGNIMSNVDTSKINIEVSLNKDEIIKGSESKKIYVKVRYGGNDKDITPYINFNINYVFNEVKI